MFPVLFLFSIQFDKDFWKYDQKIFLVINRVNKHPDRMGLTTSPVCASCQFEVEMALHFVCVSLTLATLRIRIFGKPIMNVSEFVEVSSSSSSLGANVWAFTKNILHLTNEYWESFKFFKLTIYGSKFFFWSFQILEKSFWKIAQELIFSNIFHRIFSIWNFLADFVVFKMFLFTIYWSKLFFWIFRISRFKKCLKNWFFQNLFTGFFPF
jgi:hypothetical protein